MTSRKVKVPSTVLMQAVGDEAVLLNLANEQYYGLDEVGTRFWQVLTTSADTDTAVSRLIEEFDVAPNVLAADLDRFVDELVASGLLATADD